MDTIINSLFVRFVSLIAIIALLNFRANAQEVKPNKYGLIVIDKYEDYQTYSSKDSSMLLIDLEKFIPGIAIDIKYAGYDNFAKVKFYDTAKAYLRYEAAKCLKKVQEELKKNGMELKIFDGYRPYQITEKIWDFVKNEDYAASPKTGSRHNRGCAVDLTIIRTSDKKELTMPSPYDDFTEKAHHGFLGADFESIVHRVLLKSIMEKFGFDAIKSEWWHYDFVGWQKYSLMGIDFVTLMKNSN